MRLTVPPFHNVGYREEHFLYREARRRQAETISRIRFLQKVLELGTGFRGWVAAGKETTK